MVSCVSAVSFTFFAGPVWNSSPSGYQNQKSHKHPLFVLFYQFRSLHLAFVILSPSNFLKNVTSFGSFSGRSSRTPGSSQSHELGMPETIHGCGAAAWGRRGSNSADPQKKSSCPQLASTSRRKSSSWKHSQGSSSRLPNILNNCLTKIQKHIGAVFSKGVKMESKNTQLCRKIKIRLEFSRVFFSQKNQTKNYWMPKKFAVFLKQLRSLFC